MSLDVYLCKAPAYSAPTKLLGDDRETFAQMLEGSTPCDIFEVPLEVARALSTSWVDERARAMFRTAIDQAERDGKEHIYVSLWY